MHGLGRTAQWYRPLLRPPRTPSFARDVINRAIPVHQAERELCRRRVGDGADIDHAAALVHGAAARAVWIERVARVQIAAGSRLDVCSLVRAPTQRQVEHVCGGNRLFRLVSEQIRGGRPRLAEVQLPGRSALIDVVVPHGRIDVLLGRIAEGVAPHAAILRRVPSSQALGGQRPTVRQR